MNNTLYGAEQSAQQSGAQVSYFRTFGPSLKWSQPNGKGSPTEISYSFDTNDKYSGIGAERAKELFTEALDLWSQYAPLNFKEVSDNNSAVDIRVDSKYIDGRFGTLGYAVSPQGGDITFDDGEQWSDSLFLETAVHEIGHALGLAHEDGEEAIMNSRLTGRYRGQDKPFLLKDDIEGITNIYGSGKGSVTPLGAAPKSPAPTSPASHTPNQPPANSGQNLLVNGSFENSSVGQDRFAVYRSIAGWRTTEGVGIQVDRRTSQYGAAADGGAWVELDSYGNSAITQTVDTLSGQTYNLSFEYTPRSGYAADTNGVEVLWNDQTIDTITAGGGNQNQWKSYSYTVEGADTSQLTFKGVGESDNFGGFIDDVALVQQNAVQLGSLEKPDGSCFTNDDAVMTQAAGIFSSCECAELAAA